MAGLANLRARAAALSSNNSAGALSLEQIAVGSQLARLKRVQQLWMQFEIEVPELQLCGLRTRPDLSVIEMFLEWRAITSKKGRLLPNGSPTTTTLMTEFDALRTILRAFTNSDMSRSHVKAMQHFIKTVLPTITETKNILRGKLVAMRADVEDILFYLWACDEYEFSHPRLMN